MKKIKEHKAAIGLLVIALLMAIILIKHYYDVNHGFIPAIKEVEGTFIMQVSEDDSVNSINGIYITFFEGDYYKYKSDQSPLLDKGSYERIESGVYLLTNDIGTQCIVNHNNTIYLYNESLGEVEKFIRHSKGPSFINMHKESMPD